MQETENKPVKKLTGKKVLMILLALFGVVFAVNGYMIYMALKTFTGEKEHAYLEGLHFNETLNARAKQSELGWDMSLGFTRGPAGDALFSAELVDKDKKPVTGAKMTGTIGRATQSNDDKKLVFNETKPGVYTAHIQTLERGKWLFAAKAKSTGKPDFEAETELSIR
jgi:nitrogen fixation protein FixH